MRDVVSPRGVRFWLVEDYAVPIVSLEFAFRGGAAQVPAGQERRAARCWPACSTKGAGDLDDRPSSEALDEKAIELSFHCERDAISGRMRTLARHLDRASALLRLAVNAPRFDRRAVRAGARTA